MQDLLLYGFCQISGGKNIVIWHQDRKFLGTVTCHISLFSHTCLDDICHLSKCNISLLISVQLIVQLEIINIEQDQCKRTLFIFFVFLIQDLIKIFPVQKTRQFIGPCLSPCRLIKSGIFDGNGSYRTDRRQHGQIIMVQIPVSVTGNRNNPGQIIILAKTCTVFDTQL